MHFYSKVFYSYAYKCIQRFFHMPRRCWEEIQNHLKILKIFILPFFLYETCNVAKILIRFREQFSKLLWLFNTIVVRKAKVIHIPNFDYQKKIGVVKDRENKKQLMTERQQNVLAWVMLWTQRKSRSVRQNWLANNTHSTQSTSFNKANYHREISSRRASTSKPTNEDKKNTHANTLTLMMQQRAQPRAIHNKS